MATPIRLGVVLVAVVVVTPILWTLEILRGNAIAQRVRCALDAELESVLTASRSPYA